MVYNATTYDEPPEVQEFEKTASNRKDTGSFGAKHFLNDVKSRVTKDQN
jgi:hypothetical protein